MNTLYSSNDFEHHYADCSWKDYKALVADLIKYSEPGKIIDVGAGLGYFTECANKFGLDAIGIEGSKWACEKARERGVELIFCDLDSEWPLKASQYSTIMCNQVIEHIPDQVVSQLLLECHRVLKDDGVLMLYSPSCYNRNESLNPAHINLHSPKKLRDTVLAHGFSIIDEPNYLERASLGWRILYRTAKGISLNYSERFLASANCIARKTKQ